MECWTDFRMVVGYLPQIDTLPTAAVRMGLLHRVAFVLNDSDAPHSRLYWDLVEAFVESLPSDSVTFEFDTDKETLLFTSVSLMREYVDAHPQVGRPFNQATFYVKGRSHAFLFVEPWATVGGPLPYSDSWTFAIYRETDDVTRLRDACHRVCAQHGVSVLDEMRGLAAPEQPPRWRRCVQWLLR